MEHILFVVLNLITLFLFILVGNNYRTSKNRFLTYLPAIISFSLLLGLRYNRGNDYMHYQDIYNEGMEYDQKLFSVFNDILHWLNVSDTGIFFFYSLIFILSSYCIIDYYKNISRQLIPMFLICFILFDEWFIRQAFGFCTVFFFMRFLFDTNYSIKKRILGCIVMGVATYYIHSANFLLIFIISIFYIFIHKPITYKITIPLYLIASLYFQSHMDFTLVNNILSLFSGMNHYSEYFKEGSSWFSVDAANAMYLRNPIIKIYQLIGECSFLYLGHKYLSKSNNTSFEKSIVALFNTSVVGLILTQAFFTVEIPRRLGEMIGIVWCFPFAYLMSIVKIKREKLINGICIMCLSFFFYSYAKYLLFRNDAVYPYLFIWDKLGLV